jgi:hypothetical protein
VGRHDVHRVPPWQDLPAPALYFTRYAKKRPSLWTHIRVSRKIGDIPSPDPYYGGSCVVQHVGPWHPIGDGPGRHARRDEL